jgi:hypothetical protein
MPTFEVKKNQVVSDDLAGWYASHHEPYRGKDSLEYRMLSAGSRREPFRKDDFWAASLHGPFENAELAENWAQRLIIVEALRFASDAAYGEQRDKLGKQMSNLAGGILDHNDKRICKELGLGTLAWDRRVSPPASTGEMFSPILQFKKKKK